MVQVVVLLAAVVVAVVVNLLEPQLTAVEAMRQEPLIEVVAVVALQLQQQLMVMPVALV